MTNYNININTLWLHLAFILDVPLLQEYINKHKECSKNCYCQYHNYINIFLATLWYVCLIKDWRISAHRRGLRWYSQQRSTMNWTVIDKTNMKQIAYFIEIISHWSLFDQKMPMNFLLSSSSNQGEVFIVNISTLDILI